MIYLFIHSFISERVDSFTVSPFLMSNYHILNSKEFGVLLIFWYIFFFSDMSKFAFSHFSFIINYQRATVVVVCFGLM